MKATALLHLSFIMLLLMSGCASLNHAPEAHDPWERFNRSMYNFNDKLDQNVMQPVAKGYRKITPDPVEKSVSNFFSNLGEIKVIANDLLQLKLLQALSDTGRFVVNSTIGLYGLFDVASHMKLKKHQEDFGQTLGYWGLQSGPYLVLPLLGPSSLRDTTGIGVDAYFDPLREVEDDEARYGLYTLKIIQGRAELLEAGNLLNEAALDPYIFLREAYLQRRLNNVHDGQPPANTSDAMEEEIDIFSED